MPKVNNPTYLYRFYYQDTAFQRKTLYWHSTNLFSALLAWCRGLDEGFEPFELHLEQKQGRKWVEISKGWNNRADAWDFARRHYIRVEHIAYHALHCPEGSNDDHR